MPILLNRRLQSWRQVQKPSCLQCRFQERKKASPQKGAGAGGANAKIVKGSKADVYAYGPRKGQRKVYDADDKPICFKHVEGNCNDNNCKWSHKPGKAHEGQMAEVNRSEDETEGVSDPESSS